MNKFDHFISEIVDIVDHEPEDFAWVPFVEEFLEYMVKVGETTNAKAGEIASAVMSLVVAQIHASKNGDSFLNSINGTEFKNNYNELMDA